MQELGQGSNIICSILWEYQIENEFFGGLMSSIYNMVCPNCNSDLQIGHDIKTFVCMNCGNEFTVEQNGGIIYLKLHDETKVNTAKQITNELNAKSIALGPTSPISENSLQERAYHLGKAQRQATKPNLTAIEIKVAELYEQKKHLRKVAGNFWIST